MDIFRSIGSSAGLAGLVVGMLVVLFKEIIRKRIFPLLPQREAYRLLRMIVVLSWSVALVGIASWTYLQLSARPVPPLPKPTAPLVIAGTVVDHKSNIGIGQAVIEIDGLKGSFTSEDSGNFRVELPVGSASSRRFRVSVTKQGYQPLDTSVIPPADNLILGMREK